MEIRYSVKDANKAYAERDYKLAIEIYSECVKRNPDLREALKLNIKMCAQKLGIDIATISDSKADLSKKNYSKSNYSNSNVEKKINEIKSVLQSRIQKSKSKSIFILHVYHLELAEELLRRAFYTGKGKIDTVVTCRPEIVDDVKSLLVKFEEDIMVFPLDNIGYDVLPFLIVLKAASAVGYKYFCKAHTKGDNKNESVRSAWRESLLDGVFPKSISYNHITEIFEKDVHVNAMGSYINYISYRNSKYDNHQIVRNAVKLFGLQVNENDDWGFFAGTMFWGRVSTFSKFDVLRVPEAHLKNDINSRSGEHSGFYHSIERIFGLYICGPKSKVALVDYKINKDNCKEVLRVESASAFLKGKAILRYKAYSERKQYARKKLILKSGVVDLFWCYRIYKDQKEYCDCVEKYLNKEIQYLSDDHKRGSVKLSFDGNRLNVHRGTSISSYFLDGDYLTDNLFYKYPQSEQLKLNVESDIAVSVVCVTYNHASYIRQAIESMLNQEVDFKYEILIGDDCSSDGTSEIIEELYKNNRDKIVYLKRIKNIGPRYNYYDLVSKAKGKYIAINEGDDFWLDTRKLQKQVDYLEVTPECSVLFHQVKVVEDDGNKFLGIFPGNTRGDIFITEDFIERNYIQTNSVMWRANSSQSINVDMRMMPGDWFRHFLNSLCGEVHMMEDIMSAYRKHSGGIWSGVYDLNKEWGFEQLLFYLEMNRVTNRYFNRELAGRIYTLFKSSFWHLYEEMDEDKLFDLVNLNQSLTNYFFDCHSIPIEHRSWSNPSEFVSELSNAITVDVIITAYMHEKDIDQAISSVIMQKGFFKIRVLCSDDGSTDGTRKIIKYYQTLYPFIVFDLSNDKNLGMLSNLKKVLGETNSKFVAFCEGDDYWLFESKIVRQIVFMYKNLNCTMCFNWLLLDYVDKGFSIPHPGQQNIEGNSIDFDYILKTAVIGNFSCCFYRKKYIDSVPNSYFETESAADWLFNLYVADHGPVGFLKSILSVYRVHKRGQWSGLSRADQEKRKALNYRNFMTFFPNRSDIIKQMLPEYSDNISLADIKNLDKYCKDDVRFNIENIKFNKNFLSIRGWMLDRNITSSKIESKYVVFQNKKNNKMYSLPLENVFRNDVTKSLSNGTNNFDWSGFRGADVLSLVDGYYDVYLVKIIEKEVFAKKHIKSLSVKEGFYEL